MKENPKKIRSWILPKPDKKVESEIDMLNIKTLYFISLVIGIVQTASLVLFLLTKHSDIQNPQVISSAFYVSLSIVLCLIGFFGSGYFRRKKDLTESHVAVNAFVNIFMILLIIWGMMASINTFIRGEQIITFFSVELIAVILIRLRPIFTTILVISSYTIFYLALNIWIKPGMINPYNYFMMGIFSVMGAVIIYHTTVSYIEQKNKANMLNDSLEIIANHDSATRLQNRYALNQRIPDYLNTDICIAMIDINNFKEINDTYGHRAGDDALKVFSDILSACFDHKDIYRYGGDEFLIVIQSRDLEAFRAKMPELNERFGKERISGVQDGLNCCFGCVSAHPETPEDFFTAVTQADQILYEEKTKRKAEK